jgi:hypothetical protein
MKDSSNITAQLQQTGKTLLSYRVPLFLLLLVIVYAFVAWRAYQLYSVPPGVSLNAPTPAPTTHIDKPTVQKVKQLHNNSVNVQTLFDKARKNPFHE